MREQFEAWVSDSGLRRGFGRNAAGEYYCSMTQSRWETWQAATKAEREACDASIESHVAAAIANEREACAAHVDVPITGKGTEFAAAIRARDTEGGA